MVDAGYLSINGNLSAPLISILPELLAKGETPVSLSVSDCQLGDQPLCEILNALHSGRFHNTRVYLRSSLLIVELCETTSIDLSYNLVYEPEVHKFAQKLSEVSFEEFLADPVKDAAQMGEITSTRNQVCLALQRFQTKPELRVACIQVAFMVSDLVEHESCKIQKLVLAGDPELELTTSTQEIQRCLAFGIQMALPLTSLSRNSTITHLDISGNLIGDHGASALAHALKVNRTITALRTDRNRVTTEGFVQLRKALYKNKKVVDWPPMQIDLTEFLSLLVTEREKSTQDEKAAHDMVKKAHSGGQVNLPLKEQSIRQIQMAKRVLRNTEREAEKIQRYAREIEYALSENIERAEERQRDQAIERENRRLNKRRDGFWWDAREIREKRDEMRQENFEQALMYKMWSRRARLVHRQLSPLVSNPCMISLALSTVALNASCILMI